MTCKPRALYLLFTQWPKGTFRLCGLRSKVKRAVLLAAPGKAVKVRQTRAAAQDRYVLELDLPAKAPGRHIGVVKLELAGRLDVDEALLQQPDGRIVLPAYMATPRPVPKGAGPAINSSGVAEKWTQPGSALEWAFKLWQPGRYRVDLVTARPHWEKYAEGHAAEFRAGAGVLQGKVVKPADSDSPRAQYFPESITHFGELALATPGVGKAALALTALSPQAPGGLKVSEVHLVPVKR